MTTIILNRLIEAKEMYICICRNVTEKDIQRAVKQGISSMESLSKSIGVTTHCGCCADYAHKALEEAKTKL